MMTNVTAAEMKMIEVVYPQAIEMIRHFDRVRFASWTVYTAIVAAAFFANESAERIDDIRMIAMIWIASLFFIFFVSRVQRNYKVFFGTVLALELKMFGTGTWDESYVMMLTEPPPLISTDSSVSVLPFVGTVRFTSTGFWRLGAWDRYIGAVPYFHLIISFFMIVPVIITVIYLVSDFGT